MVIIMKKKYILNYMKILIDIPGRILQYMSDRYIFNVDNLKMLVIDKVVRTSDEGF